MPFPPKRVEWFDDPAVWARVWAYEESRDWYNDLYIEYVPVGHNACYFCGRQPEEHPNEIHKEWR